MMGADSTQAVVLAGGEGTRMVPLVSPDHPKALLTIANRPMLFYSLFSLLRAGFRQVTVVVEARFKEVISAYCNNDFPLDPAVKALGAEQLVPTIFIRKEEWGTGDALRELELSGYDVLILSCDYIGDVDLSSIVDMHHSSEATCTVALVEATAPKGAHAGTLAPETKPEKGTKGKKPPKKKASGKKDAGADGFTVDHYALLDNSGSRLLSLLGKADISDGAVAIRAPLMRRYRTVQLRSDLFDAHIYVFSSHAISKLLEGNHNISSIKYDLVPYLARRQHTITKVANKENWRYPGEEIRISAHVVNHGVYVKRANTVTEFQNTNMDVATGRLNGLMGSGSAESGGDVTGGKKKGKKPDPKASPFASTGERVSVTPDSLIGVNVAAGDRVSVKKSVVGDNSKLASNVKINGCVVLGSVTLEEGVNLAGCVLCEGAVIGRNSVLKDCRVARDVVVAAGTEASNRDFSQKQQGVDADGLDEGFEFV